MSIAAWRRFVPEFTLTFTFMGSGSRGSEAVVPEKLNGSELVFWVRISLLLGDSAESLAALAVRDAFMVLMLRSEVVDGM